MGLRSSARADTDHFGAEVDLRGSVGLDLDAGHEHAIYPLDDDIEIEGRRLAVGQVRLPCAGSFGGDAVTHWR